MISKFLFNNSYNNTAITVVLGVNDLDAAGDRYSSIMTWKHHDYLNHTQLMDDIGLIKVDKDIVFGDKVQPIIFSNVYSFKLNRSITLAGWGKVSVST